MSSGAHRTLPLKWLLALIAGVLLVHIVLLQDLPRSLGLSQPQPVRAFTTRSVQPAPTPVAPAVAPLRQKPAPVTAKKPPPSAAPTLAPDGAPTPTPPPTPEPEPVVMHEAPEVTLQPNDAAPDTLPTAAEPPAAPPRDPGTLVASRFSVPGSVRLTYKVDTNKLPFSASAHLLWQQDGETYDARLELSLFGQTRVQSSRGQITPTGLAPVRFSDKYRTEVAAHFNREQGKVTFSANTPDAPLLNGAQDRLSVLLQLAAMIAGDPAHYPPASTLAIQTIGPRDADTWLFTVGHEETLALPGGTLSALKLVRNPRREFDQKVELWLAPALGYLPARIRITEPNDDFIDQQWLATEPQT